MKSIKDVQYLKTEFIRTAQNQNLTKKESKNIASKLSFYQDIIVYLESNPREDRLREEEKKLTDKIMAVDEKIAILDDTYTNSHALSIAIKSLKAEFNYDKRKKQLEVILFILN